MCPLCSILHFEFLGTTDHHDCEHEEVLKPSLKSCLLVFHTYSDGCQMTKLASRLLLICHFESYCQALQGCSLQGLVLVFTRHCSYDFDITNCQNMQRSSTLAIQEPVEMARAWEWLRMYLKYNSFLSAVIVWLIITAPLPAAFFNIWTVQRGSLIIGPTGQS